MNIKPTIVIVAHDVGGLGGMERHLEEIILRLKLEANVIVVSSTLQMSDAAGIKFIRIPVIKRPAPLRMILFALLATLRIFFIKRDVLHTTGALVFNKADITTVHFCNAGYIKSTAEPFSKNHRSILHQLNGSLALKIGLWMEKVIYKPKHTKKVVAVSNRVKSEMLDSFPYSDDVIQVIPNGVDTQSFHPYTPLIKNSLRKSLGLPEQGRFLLFMGGFWHLKGLDFVINAFNQVAGEFSDLYLLVVGKGDKNNYDKLLTPHYRNRVYFTGKQPNPQEWFGISDVFVFPSSYETFSLVVHEAAAAGLTIISTKVGGVEELIEHSVNGFIVERNVEQIAQTVREILNDNESLKCGEYARLRVEKLTWQNTYDKFITLYKEIMNEHSKDFTGSRGMQVERNNT